MTSRLEVRQFKAHDLMLIGELSDSMVGMGMLHTQGFYGQKLEESGPCFSAFDQDELIGVGGVALYWCGVGEAWLILSSMVQEFPFSLHRIVSRTLDKIITDEHLHRVQTVVPYLHMRAMAWIVRLGFKYEGLMPKYGPDGSWFSRYARVM